MTGLVSSIEMGGVTVPFQLLLMMRASCCFPAPYRHCTARHGLSHPGGEAGTSHEEARRGFERPCEALIKRLGPGQSVERL